MEPASSSKLWGGRFSASTNELVDHLNASLPFDRRLSKQDIAGSIAHASMLARQEIISEQDAEQIVAGLRQIYAEIVAGDFIYRLEEEDIHMAVEQRLHGIIGATAGRLHTGRSRNDQAQLDVRLWLRAQLTEILDSLLDAAEALLLLGDQYDDAVMPGYTHLQRAQPVLFAHHMHAYVVMLLRDAQRLSEIYERVNVSPLGAGALAGVTYLIDRDYVAGMLGFADVSRNSMDSVADRDTLLEALFCLSLISMHLSRLAEEMILWSTAEFGFVEFADDFSTGSSIMPQKKNPDIAELMRGKTGRVYGALVGLLTVTKGLPLAYNKDLQEDKEGLFDAVSTVLPLLRILPPMLGTMRVNTDRMSAAAIGGFALATDVADELARRGVPFREAHEIVGRLVATCIERNTTLEALTPDEWADLHDVFTDSPPVVTLNASVVARDVPGGTAPTQVRNAYGDSQREIASYREVLGGWQQRSADIDRLVTGDPK